MRAEASSHSSQGILAYFCDLLQNSEGTGDDFRSFLPVENFPSTVWRLAVMLMSHVPSNPRLRLRWVGRGRQRYRTRVGTLYNQSNFRSGRGCFSSQDLRKSYEFANRSMVYCFLCTLHLGWMTQSGVRPDKEWTPGQVFGERCLCAGWAVDLCETVQRSVGGVRRKEGVSNHQTIDSQPESWTLGSEVGSSASVGLRTGVSTSTYHCTYTLYFTLLT